MIPNLNWRSVLPPLKPPGYLAIVLKVLDYDGKKKAEHMCSAVTTLGQLRTGGQEASLEAGGQY